MKRQLSIRRQAACACAVMLALMVCVPDVAASERGRHFRQASSDQNRVPAPVERRPPPNMRSNSGAQNPYQQPYRSEDSVGPYRQPGSNGGGARQGDAVHGRPATFVGQHLGEWLDAHRGMPLEQQQRALETEPGFSRLNPDQQQRLHQRLDQISHMSPERQQQLIERTEAMERLQPQQRQQVRDAVAQVGHLPEYRRGAVVHAFYGLRDLPPAQRQAYMNSPQFRAQFNDEERNSINGLLSVAPIYAPLQGPPRQP